jgi:hypothetical protein
MIRRIFMSEIILKKSGEAIILDDFNKIESNFEITVPKEIQEFYLKFNGGVPSKKYFFIPRYIDNLKIRFFKVFKFENDQSLTIEESYENGIKKGFLNQNLIPFANDDAGNYFCFDKEGKIYYYTIDAWDDKLTNEENIKENLILLTDSFSEFLNKLTSKPSYK